MTAPNLTPPTLTEQDIQRFWSYIDKSPGQGPKGDCWEWQRGKTGSGYGAYDVGGRAYVASRLVFYLTYGRWPDTFALHHCDNPPCCREEHLFEGTNRDNALDAKHKDRLASGDRHWARSHPEKLRRGEQNIARLYPERLARGDRNGSRLYPERLAHGERNPAAKLTSETVLAIVKDFFVDGIPRKRIAQRRNTSYSNVKMILGGKAWKRLTGL
jgi:hypothetical protein